MGTEYDIFSVRLRLRIQQSSKWNELKWFTWQFDWSDGLFIHVHCKRTVFNHQQDANYLFDRAESWSIRTHCHTLFFSACDSHRKEKDAAFHFPHINMPEPHWLQSLTGGVEMSSPWRRCQPTWVTEDGLVSRQPPRSCWCLFMSQLKACVYISPDRERCNTDTAAF